MGTHDDKPAGYSILVTTEKDKVTTQLILSVGNSLNKAYETFTTLANQNLHRPDFASFQLCYKPNNSDLWHILSRRTLNGAGDF